MLRSTHALFVLTLLLPLAVFAQDLPLVPTLTVPTPVPWETTAQPPDVLATDSAVGDIADTGVFRVGVLYNDPPYSELTLRGQVSGFDADLLRKIASIWDVELEFVQVTRLNALDRLQSGQVHGVASAIVRYRDLDDDLDFSHTYLRGSQSMLVLEESPYISPGDLGDQAIGFVLGTRTEGALALYSAEANLQLRVNSYLTLDRAIAAMSRGEIAGVVAEKQTLLRVAAGFTENMRLLDQPVVREAHAFAVRRQDAPLRQLLNHTIHHLADAGELDVLFREYFPDEIYSEDLITQWEGISDDISPTQFAAAISYPASYALPRMLSSGVLRVGGLTDASKATTAGRRRLAELNRALVIEMANRWGVNVDFHSGDAQDATSLLSSNVVDLVVGVKPDWGLAAALDFSAPYLLHGDRLMVRGNSGIRGFNDLRGRIVGILIGDASAQDRAKAWADSINATVRFFRTTESGAAQTILEFNNANAIYADNLALLAHLEENPADLRLTERWYSHSYYAFAIPYNDPDFRLLVDYTMQEFIRDGTLLRLSAPLIMSDGLPDYDIIPGPSQFAGINLSRAQADSGP